MCKKHNDPLFMYLGYRGYAYSPFKVLSKYTFNKSKIGGNKMTVVANRQGRNSLVGGEQMILDFNIPEKYWLGARHINADYSIDMIAAGVIRVGRGESEFLYYEDSNGNPLSIFDLSMLYKAIGKENAILTEDFFESGDFFNLCVHAGYDANIVKEDDRTILAPTKAGSTIGIEELPVMFKWLIDNQDICW